MKEIIFKDFISEDKRKKVTSSTEITRKNGVLIQSCKKSNYIVHGPLNINPRLGKNKTSKKPQLYITRNINTPKNTQKITYKIEGKILVKFKNNIFAISYKHTLNIEIINLEKQDINNEKEKRQ